jgi:protein O-mannosyl-transferase
MATSADRLEFMPRPADKTLAIFVYAGLALSVLVVYVQVYNFDFINYVDDIYVYENPHVVDGLNMDGIVWAFTTGHASFWHPLTWLSLMLDREIFGMNAGGFHITSVLLHIASTLLLFAVMRKVTGRMWPSAFVAAAFALHPVHVESVAWVSERKDVLSTVFMFASMLAYVNYAQRLPAAGSQQQPQNSRWWYCISLVLFTLGLMAKPMLVTLPALLLLLDYWPLGRFGSETAGKNKRSAEKPVISRSPAARCVIEKIPFFVLSIIAGILTIFTQNASGTLTGIEAVPLKDRLADSVSSYATYIGEMLWPVGLSPQYPIGDMFAINGGMLFGFVALLAGITFLVFYLRRGREYLVAGWLWYMLMLLPVIGLIQFTWAAHPDHLTYVPYVGLFIMIGYGLPGALAKLPEGKALGPAMAISLIAIGVLTYRQVGHWRDSAALFSHAVKVTRDNYVAYANIGLAYDEKGDADNAIANLKEAVRIHPRLAEAYNNLGNVYAKQGRRQEALESYEKATKARPDYPYAEAHYGMANELRAAGRLEDALYQYREALKLQPDWPACMNNLAMLMAAYPDLQGRSVEEAVALARGACQLTGWRDPVYILTLGVAYAAAGRFDEAIATDESALQLAAATGQTQVEGVLRYHLSLFRQHKPFVEHP